MIPGADLTSRVPMELPPADEGLDGDQIGWIRTWQLSWRRITMTMTLGVDICDVVTAAPALPGEVCRRTCGCKHKCIERVMQKAEP